MLRVKTRARDNTTHCCLHTQCGDVAPVDTSYHSADTQNTGEKVKDSDGRVQYTQLAAAASIESEGTKDANSANGSLGIALPLPANCTTNDAVYWSPGCTPGRAEKEGTTSDSKHGNRRSRRRMSGMAIPDPVLTASDVGALMQRIDTGLRTRQRNVVSNI